MNFKTFAYSLLAFILLLAIGWALTANQLALNKVFKPANEQVRRETFEESKAYQDGMIKELETMQFEYTKAEPAHKAALRSLILNRAAGFPEDQLPSDLKAFIDQLKAQ